MSKKEDEFLQRLRATYEVEAAEHLQAMSTGLLELEKELSAERQAECVEIVFRHAHSLKGAARAVNFAATEAVCQSLETFFAAWKRGARRPATQHFDTLYEILDLMVKSNRAADGTEAARHNAAAQALINRLETQSGDWTLGRESGATMSAADPVRPVAPTPASDSVRSSTPEPAIVPTERSAPAGAAEPSTAAARAGVASTVRVSTLKLDKLLLEAEEMLAVKLTTARRVEDLRGIEATWKQWEKAWTKIQPTLAELRRSSMASKADAGTEANGDRMADLLEFVEWNAGFFKTVESRLGAASKAMSGDRRSFGKLVDDLLADSKQLLMLPFSTVLDLFPKLVRDLSRELGKDVELVLRGGAVEMDKRILEGMKDALIHLVRNCVDHGVEKTVLRQERGKSPRAKIILAVSPVDGGKVEILVSDDGAGVDLAKVKAAAVKQGLLAAADVPHLSEAQALALIFQSNVSTSSIITEISGRGLGMAIVREQTEKLGGQVTVETHPGMGTTFRIILPMMLATFRGLLVRVADRIFVLPLTSVERVTRTKADMVKTVENRETVQLDGRAVSLVRLHSALGLDRPPSPAPGFLPLVVFGSADDQLAFAVDEVMDEQEVLVKTLGRPLLRVRHIAGATILGSGQVVPILNMSDLINTARRSEFAPSTAATHTATKPAVRRKRILMAEDSFTSRMLLKNILETAGHEVTAAVDGAEALAELRTGDFDLVVSDIEMPRLNGFDLTARIRADQKLTDIPVILVTALGSREDRERGIDVGANAYIVKSNFDQSNLLEAVRRLA